VLILRQIFLVNMSFPTYQNLDSVELRIVRLGC
jgi:hypothetical protein